MVRVEVAFFIFGAAMFAETYFRVAYRYFSLAILEASVAGIPLGYLLGALGLLSGAGILASRKMRPPSHS